MHWLGCWAPAPSLAPAGVQPPHPSPQLAPPTPLHSPLHPQLPKLASILGKDLVELLDAHFAVRARRTPGLGPGLKWALHAGWTRLLAAQTSTS